MMLNAQAPRVHVGHHTPSIEVLLPCARPPLCILYICSSLQGLALPQPTQKQLHSLCSTTVIWKLLRSCFQPLPLLLIPARMLCANKPLPHLCSRGYARYSLLPSTEAGPPAPVSVPQQLSPHPAATVSQYCKANPLSCSPHAEPADTLSEALRCFSSLRSFRTPKNSLAFDGQAMD